jgi:hypothetical protein
MLLDLLQELGLFVVAVIRRASRTRWPLLLLEGTAGKFEVFGLLLFFFVVVHGNVLQAHDLDCEGLPKTFIGGDRDLDIGTDRGGSVLNVEPTGKPV